MKIFAVFLVTIFNVNGLPSDSQLDREKVLREIDEYLDDDALGKIANILREKKDDATVIKCEDDPSHEKECPIWKAGGACQHNKETMRQYCRKTCDDCKAPSPKIPEIPACAKTTWGCCWDNVTIARGPTTDIGQSQCPPCLDKQSGTFCKRWKMDCLKDNKGQGGFMRSHCPVTCDVPCDYNLNMNQCRDDPANVQNCIRWYEDGKCITDQAQMRVLCPAMCGFCQS